MGQAILPAVSGTAQPNSGGKDVLPITVTVTAEFIKTTAIFDGDDTLQRTETLYIKVKQGV